MFGGVEIGCVASGRALGTLFLWAFLVAFRQRTFKKGEEGRGAIRPRIGPSWPMSPYPNIRYAIPTPTRGCSVNKEAMTDAGRHTYTQRGYRYSDRGNCDGLKRQCRNSTQTRSVYLRSVRVHVHLHVRTCVRTHGLRPVVARQRAVGCSPSCVRNPRTTVGTAVGAQLTAVGTQLFATKCPAAAQSQMIPLLLRTPPPPPPPRPDVFSFGGPPEFLLPLRSVPKKIPPSCDRRRLAT